MLRKYFFWSTLFFYVSVVIVACSSPQSDTTTHQNNHSQTTNDPSTSNNATATALSAEALKGKTLFKINCAQCHLMSNEDLIGPGMKGVTERYDQAWLMSFIKNSQALIASGDEKAVSLYEKYYKTVMPSFNFSAEEMTHLLAYLKEGGE